MGKHKITGGLLVIVMLVVFFPTTLVAAETKVSLENAILTARSHFDIPEAFDNFRSEFESNSQRQCWSLNWSDEESQKGNLHIQVDATSGEIISMHLWTPEKEQADYNKVISLNQARAAAREAVKRLAANRFESLQAVETREPVPLNKYGPITYRFFWQRYANGVIVTGDGVSIEIDGRTGKVTGYDLNWTATDLSGITKAISPEQAHQIFQRENFLQKQYLTASPVRPLNKEDKNSPRLVYKIYHPSNGVIDAISGQPFIPEQQKYSAADGMGMSAGMKEASREENTRLTPQEVQEMEKIKKLITREQAVDKVNHWVNIPLGAQLETWHLLRDWYDQDQWYWNLRWEREADGNRGAFSMWARVNAFTGQLQSFNIYEEDNNQPGDMDRKRAAGVAEEFIKGIEPQLSRQVKLDPYTENIIVKQKPQPRQWSFDFIRQVEGISCPGEGIRVEVSTADGKITSYNLTWSESEFPPAVKSMNQAQAEQVFLEYAPLTLCYIKVYNNRGSHDLKLVYRPLQALGQPELASIDAVSGEKLSWEGKPVSQYPTSLSFSDIAGHYAEKEIRLLGQAGLMGEYGAQFRPGESISLITFLRAMLGASDGLYSINGWDDESILKRCREKGWISGEVNPQEQVSREMLIKTIIRSLQLDYIAGKNIFVNPFPEDATVTDANRGYVALAQVLGFLRPGTDFNGLETITRGETAYSLARSLQVPVR